MPRPWQLLVVEAGQPATLPYLGLAVLSIKDASTAFPFNVVRKNKSCKWADSLGTDASIVLCSVFLVRDPHTPAWFTPLPRCG